MAEKGKDADNNLKDCLNEQYDSDDGDTEGTPAGAYVLHDILPLRVCMINGRR